VEKAPMKKSADEIIKMIAETLAESDGEFVEQIANQVMTDKVSYIGDWMFEVGTGEDDSAEQSMEGFKQRGFEVVRDGGTCWRKELPNGLTLSVEAGDNSRPARDGDFLIDCVTA
jgi:hypothetical protein